MKKLFLFIIIIMLLISCAAQTKGKKKNAEPEWMQNPKKSYPEVLYLTAIGEGDTRSEAEDFAASNLAKIFESNVSTNETYHQRYLELIKNDEIEFEDITDVSKDVNIQAEQTLYNIQFSEGFTDELGRVHVLAYLNRTRTADIYEEKISSNSEKILYYEGISNSAQDVRIKYAAMNAASVISENNEILMDQLNIISPDSKEFIEIGYDHNEITRLSSQYAREISFQTDIAYDDEGKITDIINNLLTEMGFVSGRTQILSISGEIKFQETDLKRDDFKFIRYELTLQVKDDENVLVSSLSEKGKEGHVTYFEAKERCIRNLGDKIERSLRSEITDYFDSFIRK
ncbi:hypothetical protein ACFLYK_03525 [Candidatus Cloacimonadota bacterium]